AKTRTELGILPNQLQSGTYKGRWADQHNARLVYHYIIVRGLAALLAVLPAGDPDYQRVWNALDLALQARNNWTLAHGLLYDRGTTNLTTGMSQTLSTLSRMETEFSAAGISFPDDSTSNVIDEVARQTNVTLNAGAIPANITPDAWGLFLNQVQTVGITAKHRAMRAGNRLRR
ncbi:MAG: hypothetical protein JO103_15220, partial [Candidatus Eremiobacteraeota bacterium]|nr:hypothetical protein [Candidatus Eremiobacteraeota bacterium]